MLIDTHCHLDFPDFDPDRSQVIQRANEAGVTRLISIGTTLETSRAAIALADSNPQIFATVGLHPCEVQEASDSTIDEFVLTLGSASSHHPFIRLTVGGPWWFVAQS